MYTILRKTGAVWALISTLGFGGCATTTPTPQTATIPALGHHLPRATVPETPASGDLRAEFSEPDGELTLRQALGAALINNPQLFVFAWENRAREAEALQAGLGPNPELGLELENFGGSGEVSGIGGSETTLTLSQLIELGDKRNKRVALAELEQGLSAWDYESARLDVLTEVTQKFVATLAAQENVTLTKELVDHAQEMLDSVHRRVRAGSASPVEESRARVSLETSRIETTRAEYALVVAKKKLSATWGSVTPAFSAVLGDLTDTQTAAPLITLQEQLAENPELARWATEVQHRRAAINLAKAFGTIDLSVGGGVRYLSESDDVAFVINVGLPLKFNNGNEGATKAAEFRLQRTEAQKRAATHGLMAQLSETYESLLANEAEIKALRDLALPEAEKALDSAEVSYLRGAMRFSDVLDTKRMFFALKQRYFMVLANHHFTVAEIERLTGAAMGPSATAEGRQ